MFVAFGAILWLLAVIGDAAHGVLMFPILKQHSERAATGYLAARIVDAIFIAIMVLFILMQIPLGAEFTVNYEIPKPPQIATLTKDQLL